MATSFSDPSVPMADEVYSLVHDKNVTLDHIQLYFEEQNKQLAIEPYFDYDKIEVVDRNILQAIADENKEN